MLMVGHIEKHGCAKIYLTWPTTTSTPESSNTTTRQVKTLTWSPTRTVQWISLKFNRITIPTKWIIMHIFGGQETWHCVTRVNFFQNFKEKTCNIIACIHSFTKFMLSRNMSVQQIELFQRNSCFWFFRNKNYNVIQISQNQKHYFSWKTIFKLVFEQVFLYSVCHVYFNA